jgi:tetratricopeptide (TPR) repeat protein/4-amino-4-deoxy-L-arabinose transferase-like glycosyltransferase
MQPASAELRGRGERVVIPGLVLAVALIVRIVHVWQIRRSPYFSALLGDSRGYDEWAQRIAGGEWWGREVFYQAPLYPYFLGTIFAVAGRNLLLVRLVQAAIGSASCVFVSLAAGRLFGRRAGLVAGLMMALYAPAIFFDGLLQKSVLDVFFVALALWLIARIAAPGDRSHVATRDWLWLGVAMGGLSLTRENALVLVVVILAWAFLWRSRREALRNAATFLAGLIVVIGPVAIRNSLVGGGFYVTTSQMGPNFYIGNNPKADGTYASLRYGRGAPEYERQDATEIAERAVGRPLSPSEVSSYWTDRALEFITSQPGAWLRLMERKVALLWNRAEVVDTEDQASHAEWSLPLRILGPVGHFGVLVPLALLGVILTWPMRSRLWVLYAMLAAYAASVVAFYVFARYRFPMVPMLIVFAAGGIVTLASLIKGTTTEDTGTSGGHRKTQGSNPAPSVRIGVLSGRAFGPAVVAGAEIFTNWPLLSTDLMRAVTESNLAAALQADHRLDEAVDHYRRAIALRADYAPAYSNLGTALRARGQIREAVASYEQALRLRPDFPDAHYNLANALMAAGRSDAAIPHFQTALRSISAPVEVHNNLGIALASAGRRDEAFAEFDAALQADPRSAAAHRNLADVLLSAGRGPEALDHFRRATELAPADGGLRYDYGSVLLEAGRPADAAREFAAAIASMPQSPEAHNNLGIALGSQGKIDEAVAEFETALRIKPDFVDARRNLDMVRRTTSNRRGR